jgi:phosphomannomutase / phosphoglucomutase
MMEMKRSIFREYDIRALAHAPGELTPENVVRIVNAYLAYKPESETLLVGSDWRASAEEFRSLAVETIRRSGRDVVDIGTVTTPVFYFAQYHLELPVGFMITASHNPPDWNGFKLADGFSSTLVSDGIAAVRDLAFAEAVPPKGRGGAVRTVEVIPAYEEAVASRVRLGGRKLRVVVDCGNGAASLVAPRVFERLGAAVQPLFCDLDHRYPNHPPNPSDLSAREAARRYVRETGADLALLFDGDGDRLGVIDEAGRDVWSDQVLLLLALRLLEQKGTVKVVFDVKCTQALSDVIAARGGEAIMWKTGHSHIKQKSREVGADIAGERSGHLFIADRWYGFDDAVMAGACLLETLSHAGEPLSGLLGHLPRYVTSPEIHAHCPDEAKYRVVDSLLADFKREFPNVIDINGARVVLPGGWGLVRASSNLPELVLVFEAGSEEGILDIYRLFREKCARYPEISGEWENDVYLGRISGAR